MQPMKNIINETKSHYSIEDVINILGLKQGENQKYYTPKGERTASVMIYPNSNSFFDFSEGKGGDQLEFYKHYTGCSLSEVIKLFNNSSGINNINSGKLIDKRKKDRYTFLSNYEHDFFEERAAIIEHEGRIKKCKAEDFAYKNILQQRKEIQNTIFETLYNFEKNGIDTEIYKYLREERCLTDSTINEFKLFSLNNPLQTSKFLRDSFNEYELKISGLFSGNKFLFLHHPIIIPYIENSRIVFLRARAINNNTTYPKYLFPRNVSRTLTSKRFFNKDVLKNELFDVVLCEGEFDAILANQYGYSAIGIPGVHNFPIGQSNLLKGKNVYFFFDADKAGQKAVEDISSQINSITNSIKNWILPTPIKDLTEYKYVTS